MNQPLILIVGAADTGRAPLAAAMLRRFLERRNIAARVESAGILGHDDDPASPDALAVAEHMELDLHTHRARSLNDELAHAAALLLAIDTGTARVARMRFPQDIDRIHTLGELAGRDRDIPDPFKMQIGPWLMYAREIEHLLEQALPRIIAFVPGMAPAAVAPPPAPAEPPAIAEARRAAAERTAQLLDLMLRIPGVVEWNAARDQVEATIAAATTHPAGPADLVAAYGALLRAALALTPAVPSAGQLAALRDALTRLEQPLASGDLSALSAQLGGWVAL